MDDFNFVEDDDLDINAMFDNQDEFPLDDEFIRTHFNTLDSETIQNFPFVEDDIDAITDYELFSKGFGYLDEKKADKEELKDYAKKSEIPDVSDFVTKDTNELENYPLSSSLSDVAFSGSYDDLTDKPVIPDVSNYVTKDTTELENYTLTSDLSEVALSGNYNDLSHKPNIPTKTSDLSNDSGFIDKDVNNLTNYTKTSSLATVATSGNYNDLSHKPIIPDVSNFITKDVDDLTYYTKTSNLSTVATSGNYNDLSNKPTIPTVPTNVSAFTNDAGYITKTVNDLTNYTKTSSLATVATSGSYNDLSNKPSIPTYDSGTFTPTILGLTTAGTATYTTQEGRYIKIGNLLHIEIKLVCKLENSNGYIGIRGFPTNLGTLHDAGVCNVNTDLTTSNYPLFARVYYTQNLLLQYGNGGAYNTGWSTNKNIYLSGTFILT